MLNAQLMFTLHILAYEQTCMHSLNHEVFRQNPSGALLNPETE